MTRRKVLIFGLDYWPDVTGIAPYTTAFAEYLAEQGDRVDVVAGMPYYPEWTVRAGYEGALRRTEERNGVTIHRRRQYIPSRQSAPLRGAYEATFLLNASLGLDIPHPDVVIGVMPALADGILAARVSRKFEVPLTLWVQDLFAQAAVQSGVRGGVHVASVTGKIEGWVARQADAIAIIAEGFRQPLESMGVAPDRIHRVRNWTHISPPTMTQEDARRVLGLPLDRTICMHAGNMGLKQGLENVIDAARLAVKSAPALYFVLMGDGSQRASLEQQARGLSNIRFLDPVDSDMFPNALYAADILLINQLGTVIDMSLPSKLTSYLAVGRPIIAAVHPDSESAFAVEESDGGVVIAPDAPRALVIEGMALASNGKLMSQKRLRGQTYAQTELSQDAAMAQLARVIGRPFSLERIDETAPGEFFGYQ